MSWAHCGRKFDGVHTPSEIVSVTPYYCQIMLEFGANILINSADDNPVDTVHKPADENGADFVLEKVGMICTISQPREQWAKEEIEKRSAIF